MRLKTIKGRLIARPLNSAPLNGGSEDFGVLAVIVSELKLSDVQMQIFFANLMISSNNATFQNRPEALNRIGVNCSNDMLANGVINELVREAMLQPHIAGVSISAEKANAVRDGFPNESFKRLPIGVLDNASNYVALALDCPDNGGFARITTPTLAAFLVPMPVLVAAADVGFINLDDAAKLLDVLDHGRSNLVAHEPSSLVGAEAHISEDLKGAHTLLTDQHEMGDSIPILQRLIRVLKDCAGQVREAVARFRRALVALPMPWVALQFGRFWGPATRAHDAVWPAAHNKICNAIVLSLKHRVELRDGQLVDGFWVGGTAHNEFLSVSERKMACA